MDLREARRLLGVEAGASWAIVRQAYRNRVRTAHPDVSAQANANADTSRLTEAYATVRAAHQAEPAVHAEVTRAEEPSPDASDAQGVALVGDDTIVVPAPADEAFALLLEAAHGIGHVSFIDRSSGFLEAVVTVVDGPACSVVVSLQGRAVGGTEAFVTIEALGQAQAPPVGPFTAALAAAVAQRWPA